MSPPAQFPPPVPSTGPASPGMSPEGKQTLKIVGIVLGVISVVFGCPIGCCLVGRIMIFRAAESAVEFRLKYHDRLEAFAKSELERRGCTDIDYRFSPSYDGQQEGGYLMSLVGTCDYRAGQRNDFKVEMLVVDEDIRLKSIRIDGTDTP